MDQPERELASKIAAARRILYNEGCDSQTAGHVSARAGTSFFVTPWEYFDETLPGSVVEIPFQTNDGGAGIDVERTSPAVAFHAAIYAARPDVNGIVHHHGRYTAVVSSTGSTIGMYNLLAYVLHDDQALIEDIPGSRVSDPARIAVELGSKNVLLMKNHGCIVVGSSIEEATIRAVFVELAARYHVECTAIGGTPLDDPQHLADYRANLTKFMLPSTWEAQVRRLRSSAPELFADARVPA